MSGSKENGQRKALIGLGDRVDVDGNPVLNWVPLSSVLVRLSKINFGQCWRYHTPYDLAAKIANMSLNSFCMFYGINHSEQIESMVQDAMRIGFDVYYTRTGRERESPNGEEALEFEQVGMKPT